MSIHVHVPCAATWTPPSFDSFLAIYSETMASEPTFVDREPWPKPNRRPMARAGLLRSTAPAAQDTTSFRVITQDNAGDVICTTGFWGQGDAEG